MSSVDKTVYKVSDVYRLSFGKVVEQESCKGWIWYKVVWANDPPANIHQSPNYDSNSGWFRCDTVVPFDTGAMMNLLQSLK
jgi:hypothetical protein